MRNLKRTVGAGLCLISVLSAGGALADKAAVIRSHTGQLIIQLDGDAMSRMQTVARGQAVPGLWLPDGRTVNFVRRLGDDAIVVRLPEGVSLKAAKDLAAGLAAQPGVAAAEPDKRFTPAFVPDDTEYLGLALNSIDNPGQWNLFEPVAGINMEPAWDLSTGSPSVFVAILDTGIIAHRDLNGARILPGYDFISDPTTANDGDGRDPDPSDPGDWAVQGDSCYTGDPSQDNSSWHGLSIAGVIGATSNNTQDIAGIDFHARLLPVRVLGKCGGSLSDLIDAIQWAAGLSVAGVPDNPFPAKVINLSLDADGLCSPLEQGAINAAVGAGAVVVAAAGNGGKDVSNVSPANCNNVVVVGAIARDGRLAAYANTGANVDLTAPGGDTPSPPDPNNPPNGILTLSNFGTTSPDTTANGDALAVIQGTSFSAAQVSAVASLMLAVNPALTPGTLESLLKGSTRTFPDPSCNTSLCGTGVLDADAALVAALKGTTPSSDTTPPSVPQNLSATPVSSTQIDLSWSASMDSGGGVVAGYWVYRDGNPVAQVTTGTTYYSDTGLSPDTAYSYTVSAYDNAAPTNESAQSATVNATTTAVGATATTNNGGGGCRLSGAGQPFDPLLWALAGVAGLFLVRRRAS